MSRICQVTKRKTQVGNRVSRRGLPKYKGGIGLKTTGIRRRTYKINLHWRRIYVPELGTFVRVRLSTKAIKTLEKKGAYRTLVEAGVIRPVRDKSRKSPSALTV